MTEKISQIRRQILKITGYSLLAGTAGVVISNTAKATMSGICHDPRTPHAASMRAIGEAYLNKYPGERSRSALLDAIQSHPGLIGLATSEPAPIIVNRLITEDFRTDHLVYLHGWALSRTEARLAALTIV